MARRPIDRQRLDRNPWFDRNHGPRLRWWDSNHLTLLSFFLPRLLSRLVDSNKIMSVSGSATKVLEIATQDSNKRILDAKEPSTRRNREYEKNEVVKFFHNNYNSLVALFELYNLFHDIKQEINR